MDVQEFGRQLKDLRRKVGLTQRALAQRLGVHYSYISKIENGVVNPPSDKLIGQFALELGVDKEELAVLAGRIPSDVSEILRRREATRLFSRSLVGKALSLLRGGQTGNTRDETRSLGARLKDLRERAGLSQKRVATEAGISAAYLCKLEKNSLRPPRNKIILALADVLSADRNELLNLTGRIPPELAQMMNTKEAWESVRSGRTMKNSVTEQWSRRVGNRQR